MHVKCMYYVQVKQLKHFAHALEQEVRSLKHTNKILESSVQERVSHEVLEQLKKQHSVHKVHRILNFQKGILNPHPFS